MSKFTFTNAALKSFFEANPSKTCWDKTQRGCGAYQVRSTGAITLFCQWRFGPRQMKKALGRLGEISLQQARQMAAEYGVAGRHGRDVLNEQRQAQAKAVTLGDAFLAHREALTKKGASAATLRLYASQWRLRLAKHQGRPLTSLTRKELREWHQSWGQAGDVTAACDQAPRR
jgi:hypothetical protein